MARTSTKVALLSCASALATAGSLFFGLNQPPAGGGATPAYVSSISADDASVSGTTVTTGSLSVPAGSGILIWTGYRFNCTVGTISASSSIDGAATAITAAQGNSDIISCTRPFYIASSAGGSMTFTMTTSAAATYKAVCVVAFSGVNTLDQSTTVSGSDGSSGYKTAGNSVQPPTWTTTSANEIEFVGGYSYSGSRTFSADTGWTLASSISPTQLCAVQYKVVSSTQSGVTGALTVSGGVDYIQAQAATFK